MFKKATAFIILVGLACVTSVAAADDSWRPRPGTKGTVTAYELDGATVIDVKWCPRDRYGAHDYMFCGDALRAEIKSLLCSRGSGTHTWLYQIGDSRPMPSTVYCHY